MPPGTDLARKLLLKPGSSFLVVDAPKGYGEMLEAAAIDVRRSETADGRRYDLVQVFVRDQADLSRKAKPALESVHPGGILWTTYPKQTGSIESDLNRDRVRELTAPFGWRTVTQISIDDTWSAMRLRPEGEVGR
jgi:hypothetical protein